jgi:hypothetical protein
MAGNPAGPDTWPYIAPNTNGMFDEGDNDDTVPLLTFGNNPPLIINPANVMAPKIPIAVYIIGL